MDNEIKKILNSIKSYVNQYGNEGGDLSIPFDKWKLLVDYITNLQEENERLKNGYCELKVKCNNGECDCTNEEYEGMVQANMRISILLDDYKSRIDKAIEYINAEKVIKDGDTLRQIANYEKNILEILQGEDKEMD